MARNNDIYKMYEEKFYEVEKLNKIMDKSYFAKKCLTNDKKNAII